MRVFQWWLRTFGVVVTGIAAAHLLFGQSSYIGGGTVNATMESDLRFYCVLFAAYGIRFIWAAGDLTGRARVIDLLGLLFFLGGLARLLAWAVAGPPNWFYIVMIPVELIIPLVHVVVVRKYVTTSASRAITAPN